MRNLVRLIAVAAFLVAPALACAQDTGFYVAPKFIYSYQMIEEAKMKGEGFPVPQVLDLGDKEDSTAGGAIAIGYDLKPKLKIPMRVEAEYAIRSQSKANYSLDDSGGVEYSSDFKFDIQTLLFNVYYDIDTGTSFTPYVGAGIGAAFIHGKNDIELAFGGPTIEGSSSKDVTNFAWNVGAGMAYAIDKNWSLDLGYRYVDFGDVKTGGVDEFFGSYNSGEVNLSAHEVMLGARYTF